MKNRFCTGRIGTVVVFVVLAMLFVITPSFSQSEETIAQPSTDAEEGETQGKTDARGNGLWFLSGLFLPGVGMILPWVFSPTVPSDKLIGKSEVFVDAYRKAYVHKKKVGNFLWSLAGFGTAATVVGVTTIAVVGSAAASAGTACGSALSEGCGGVVSDACSNAISPTCSGPTIGCGSFGLLPTEALALLAAP
jgi:ABC-type glycerol-3-phosphate transport system permease component